VATGRDMGRASVAAFSALVAGSTYSIFGFMFMFFYVICAHKNSMIGAILCAHKT
jgi:hypothetical protein